MKLMNQITCFARCEDGVGMEGMGTWNNGPRSAPKCTHYTCIANKRAIKVLLHITHVGQCPPTWVHDKLLGSRFGDVWPTGWDFGDYYWGHVFHYRPITTRSTGQLRGHWQGRWPFKCPELHRCVLHTMYPEERELCPYCTYPWFHTTGTDEHHREDCRILFFTFSYMKPNEIGSGLYAWCPLWLVLRSCPHYQKTTLRL